MRVDLRSRVVLACLCCFMAPLGATEIPELVPDHERALPSADEDSLSKTGDDLWRLDQQVKENPRAIQPHKRNYYTLSYFDSDLNGTANEVDPFESELDHTEIKFQVSMRVPVVENMFGSQADLYTAYTITSFWQALNSEISSPFREINHEPELFVMWPTQWHIGPILSRAVSFGFNHQSN
ncbi:MAG: phospholipase A, partial [Granulosicoccaceae bacterium]